MNGFTISDDKNKLDIVSIHDFLTNRSYWAKGRSLEIVKCSIENSLCFGMYDTTDKMIGFARVLTDYAIFAYIMDVFILEDYRNRGLGKQLMEYIMKYPGLQELKRIMLATKDAHGLYEKYGFEVSKNPETMMEKINQISK